MEQILLIDDSYFICDFITKILTSQTTQVITASSSQQAFEKLEEMTPDLILLDMVLSDSNGYEICRQLKEITRLKNTPIIFITANSDVSSIVKGFETGASDYICKPFSAEELTARISCHLQNKLISDELQKTNNKLLKMMEEIKMLSYKDALTNCYNRRYFLEKIESWKKDIKNYPKASYLYMIDVDSFKEINDIYGHTTGDYALYTIADILRNAADANFVVGRWGGDEFLIIAFSVTEKEAAAFGNHIIDIVNHYPFSYESNKFTCSLTIGITKFFPELSIEQNLTLADEALYTGKRNGRNCCILAANSS